MAAARLGVGEQGDVLDGPGVTHEAAQVVGEPHRQEEGRVRRDKVAAGAVSDGPVVGPAGVRPGVRVVDGLEDGAQRLDDVGQADFGFRDLFGGLFRFGRLHVGLILGGFVAAVYGLGRVFLFLGRSRGDGCLGVCGPGFPGGRFGDVEETAHTASSVPTRT